MKDRFKLRAVNVKTKEIIYIKDLYWFEEEGIHNIDDDGIARGISGEYYINQCTGLEDENGKLIYEGDIVKFSSRYGHTIFEIKWSDEFSTFGYEDDETDFGELGRLYQEAAYVKILWNIYENPELLEVNNAN